MKVVILHGEVLEGPTPDEEDVLVQKAAVSRALCELGDEPLSLHFSFDLRAVTDSLRAIGPDFVFNLVESIGGRGQFIHLAPALLDFLRLPYSGSPTEAMFLSSNKLVSKKILTASGIATPPWLVHDNMTDELSKIDGPLIIKSVWEHASIGLGEDSVLYVQNPDQLRCEMDRRRERLGGDCFVELYVDGREFNISLLAGELGPEVLPPGEIRFEDYGPDKLKLVGYDAKWLVGSFEYDHTPRRFDFPREDKPLLRKLCAIAKKCWHVFGLRGYARVDFRVDREGKPWVLEVNANPCLSPDSGFVDAAERIGLSHSQVVQRIIADSLRPSLTS